MHEYIDQVKLHETDMSSPGVMLVIFTFKINNLMANLGHTHQDIPKKRLLQL
eukprot:CAMPEP_0116954980 /NCGR_PEP_ID=MMETSP0467-20121206/42318_1 /TAXON_ID=283647 /ORGANISM="Mesodinium pulex, Strain SPMC105" /LENGTH=51 /DNA_ID=CAMNT_0004640881 /DNA_START=316 /DNA_END=471 /DNA_ORIENTATION=+